MAEQITIEQRLAILETEVRELKRQINASQPEVSRNWVDRISGSMADFPEFDEVARLGREIRQADRPPVDANAE